MPVEPKHRAVKFPLKIILLSWLLVGTLDILSAFVDYYIATGKNPLAILSYIASGVFGKSALGGGAGIMLAGLLLHYFIACCFTLFFFWLYAKTNLLAVNRVLTGIAYGLFIWIIMNLAVVQLSGVPHGPVSAMKMGKVIKAALILICMIGLPLSFIAYKYTHKTVAQPAGNNAQAL